MSKIKHEMLTNDNFAWTVAKLKTMIKWKKDNDIDEAIPTSKADCLARYEATKDRPSPTVSPMNSYCEVDMRSNDGDGSV